MPRECYTAVIERNAWWRGDFTTEPYEAGRASEVLIFVRVLESTGDADVSVEVSPDGMHWYDEGTRGS